MAQELDEILAENMKTNAEFQRRFKLAEEEEKQEKEKQKAKRKRYVQLYLITHFRAHKHIPAKLETHFRITGEHRNVDVEKGRESGLTRTNRGPLPSEYLSQMKNTLPYYI